MRTVSRLVGVLIVALLFAVPVATTGAQGGGSVNGFMWDGITFVPDITGPASPEALPSTGLGANSGACTYGFVDAGSFVYVCGDPAVAAEPLALPQTGGGGATTDIYVPSNLPAPGETELTIGELSPSALPQTGSREQAVQGGTGYWEYLDDFIVVGPNAGALTSPAGLPQTGGAESKDMSSKRLDPTQDCRWC